MTRSHFQRLREWALDEVSDHVTDTTIAGAEASERVRADRLETPTANPVDVARIQKRWADYEANRVPKFLRGEFHKRRA